MPAAEAKKVEGASWTALRIPSPPHLTGSVACVQVRSFSWKLTLTMRSKLFIVYCSHAYLCCPIAKKIYIYNYYVLYAS